MSFLTRETVCRRDVGVVDEPSGDRVARRVAIVLRELRNTDTVGVWCQEGPREGTVYVMAACTDKERPVLQEAVRAAI